MNGEDSGSASRARCPIVGSKFYPLATEILQFLPVGASLFALAEPDNKFDPNAIQVWIETKNIPQVTLDRLPGRGVPTKNTFDQSCWQLGHIAKDFARALKARGFPNDPMTSIPGTYTVGKDGGNRILLPETYEKEVL